MKHLLTPALLLLALLLPATASAHDFEVDGIYYNINGNEAEVTYRGTEFYDFDEYSGNVIIPSSVYYNGYSYSVTSIGSHAFFSCSLTSVEIPNSVTSIGDNAFRCSGLTSIDIPNSVTSIGESAFSDCGGLISITIPNSITSIGNGTFLYCVGLVSIDIPNSVTSIGDYAFGGCFLLTNVNIPNSVTSIGDEAFSGCTELTSIDIPNSVTTIGDCAFSGCSSLATISVASDNPKYDSRNNCNAIIETATNTLIAGCKNTTIPNSVTSIGGKAFSGYSSLTNINIPNSVTVIGELAFDGCSGLTAINIPNSVIFIGEYAFYECTRLTSISIPNSVTSIGNEAFGRCIGLTDVYSYITDLTIVDTYGSFFNLESDNYSNRTLLVPYGTSAAYQADSHWGPYFGSIVEMGPTNYFSMPDTTVFHGDTIVIPVQMYNEDSIMAFQTDIYLPEGFTLVTNEDDEPLIIPSSRLTSDHVIMADQLNDGSIRVICYTPRSKVISGNEGDLFYITVAVPEEADGDYTINLRNSLLTTTDYEELNTPDTGAVLHVNTYIPGDVNDSRTVNVTDIVVAAQYILQRNPSPFIFEAADMNGDGNITVTDIMLIARLIMTPPTNALLRAPVINANSDCMSGESIALSAGETRTVTIALDNVMDYSAFQLDLNLPDGLTASNFQLTDRAGSHDLDVETIAGGKVRVLCYSPTITAINGNDGALLTFEVTAAIPIMGDITVDGIEMVTTACQTVLLNAFTIGVNNMTAVNELATGKTVARVDYFNLAGQRLDRPENGVTLVVTTYTDGTRTATKLIH